MTAPNLFQGKRIRLSVPRPEDAEILARWSEDPDYMRRLDTDFARPRTAAELGRWHGPGNASSSNSVLFHLRTIEGDELIGFVALFEIEWNNQSGMMSIGIGNPEYRSKGYGREALELLTAYAFRELNLFRIGLTVNANNSNAIQAYERAGFKQEGRMRAAIFRDGQRIDRLVMGILRTDWEDLQPARVQITPALE